MARAPPPAASIEPAILRLQLELSLPRKPAEACVRAGFRSAAEIAAADDAEFHRRVPLDAAARARVLGAARTPASKRPAEGAPPRRARDMRPAEKIAKAARPARDMVSKLVGSPEPRRAPARSTKAMPLPEFDEGHRRRRTAANELEAELDAALSKDG